MICMQTEFIQTWTTVDCSIPAINDGRQNESDDFVGDEGTELNVDYKENETYKWLEWVSFRSEEL